MRLPVALEDDALIIRLPGVFTDHRSGEEYTIKRLGDFEIDAVEINVNVATEGVGRVQPLRLVNAKDGTLHWMCVE